MVGVKPVLIIGIRGINSLYAHLFVCKAQISIIIAIINPPIAINIGLFILNVWAIKTKIDIIIASTTAALNKTKDIINPPW